MKSLNKSKRQVASKPEEVFVHETFQEELDILESYEEPSKASEKEKMSTHYSSIIMDKYQEDMEAPTVANKIADMIIDLESLG